MIYAEKYMYKFTLIAYHKKEMMSIITGIYKMIPAFFTERLCKTACKN